jgi:hypothetical protein
MLDLRDKTGLFSCRSARRFPACLRRGKVMGKEARVALLLAGAACLTAVMVEWVIEELK